MRNIRTKCHFVGRQAQNLVIDFGEPFHFPVFRRLLDQAIELRPLADHAGHQTAGELFGLGAAFKMFEK